MDASRVDELVNRALDEQVDEYRRWREEAAALAERVERLEAAIEALRVELAASIEDATRAGVVGEVERLSGDLRRQISDLGRLIVNDLGRLPTLLAQRPSVADADDGTPDALDLRDRPDADAEPNPDTDADAGRGLELPYAADEARRGLFRRR